jgi:hypothetical protein
MAKHVLEIIYTPEEISALGTNYGAANAEIRKNAPVFPLPNLGLSPGSTINQYNDTSRDFGVTTRKCPFRIQMYSSASANGKDTFDQYTVCQ